MTAVFVPVGATLLQIIVAIGFRDGDRARGDVMANLIVATVLNPPYYLAMRRIVWQVEGSDRVRRDTVVFWVLAAAGVIASSATLWTAAKLFPTDDAVLRGARVFLASMAGTGLFWISRYLIADRVLFRDSGNSAP